MIISRGQGDKSMTIEEIETNLPNGFHDAVLKKINIDYVSYEADLEIKVGLSNFKESKRRLSHRQINFIWLIILYN